MNADLLAQKAIDRLERDGAAALSETERTIAAVWLFLAGVNNGGFGGYFKSSRAILARDVPAALVAIGAPALAALAREANALFGPAGPPADRARRKRALEAFPVSVRLALSDLDERYFAAAEDVDQLLEEFANRFAHVH